MVTEMLPCKRASLMARVVLCFILVLQLLNLIDYCCAPHPQHTNITYGSGSFFPLCYDSQLYIYAHWLLPWSFCKSQHKAFLQNGFLNCILYIHLLLYI